MRDDIREIADRIRYVDGPSEPVLQLSKPITEDDPLLEFEDEGDVHEDEQG